MIDSIFYIILIIEIYLFARLDYLKWGTLVTPFNMLAILFGLVTSLAIAYSYSHPDVKNFYLPSLIVWIIGLAVFYIPSSLIHYKATPQQLTIGNTIPKKDHLYVVLYGITLFFILLALIKIRSVGVNATVGTDEFSEGYDGAAGAFAHISMFLSMMFAYFFYKIDRKHKLAAIPIVLILFISFAQASKTHILAPLLMGFFTRLLTGKTRLSLKIIIIISLSAASVFFGIYFISIILSGATDSYDVYFNFVTLHFLDYFLGGTLSFSLDYQYGILEPDMTTGLVSPFLSVWEKVTGITSTAQIDNPLFLNMGDLGETNVRTFFGTIFAYSKSYVVLIILTFFISTLVYTIYYFAIKKRNIFLIIATSANLTYLIFGSFFDFYWIHLYPYEIVVISYILFVVSSIEYGASYKKTQAAA